MVRLRARPAGQLFDPDELLTRCGSGAPVDDLIFRADRSEHAGRAFRREGQAA